MVGDSISDMQFGRKLGMKTVFITHDKAKIAAHAKLIDQTFNSLSEYTKLCF
jgi:phosphoglycolate phosphatase-like HAD superfamily hydrolase